MGAPCNVCERDDARYASHHAHEAGRHGPGGLRRAACATPWASTGTRRRRSCGSPTTAAT
ncbi:MAG: hypothetical protein MZV64_28115 [Ignavibacteriales bacterium]|nr:hypothetical protein [Ignavibacteriales bacterium]